MNMTITTAHIPLLSALTAPAAPATAIAEPVDASTDSSSRSIGLARSLALALAGSLLIAASAQVAVHLSPAISVVPVTGQTFAVLLVAALLGWRLSVAAVLMYLAQGAAGLPVFASGGGGAAYLAGPTTGYLIGFVFAAAIVGKLAQSGCNRSPVRTAMSMTLGTAVIFTSGMVWLGVWFVGADVSAVLAQGLTPFVPGAVIKIALATAVLPVGFKVLAMFSGDR